MSGKIVDSEYKLKSDYQSICRDIANTIFTHDESLNLLSIKEIDKIIKSNSSYHKLPCIPKYSEILRVNGSIISSDSRLFNKKRFISFNNLIIFVYVERESHEC